MNPILDDIPGLEQIICIEKDNMSHPEFLPEKTSERSNVCREPISMVISDLGEVERSNRSINVRPLRGRFRLGMN